MHLRKIKIIYLLIFLITFTSCKSSSSTAIAVDEEPNPSSESKPLITSFFHTFESQNTVSESNIITNVNEIESECSSISYYYEIDLNYDDIPEAFYPENNEYKVVMYTDESKKKSFYDIKIPRIESIDIYRKKVNNSNEILDYRYYFSYIYSSSNRGVSFSLIYTGSDKDRTFNGWSYTKNLAPNIEYTYSNVSSSKEEFDEFLQNPYNYLYERENLEFVESIQIENYINGSCSQEYLSEITINDNIDKIQLYLLDNDIFDKKFKLANKKYCYYADDFDLIEIFERYPNMKIPTKIYKKFDVVSSNEKDYLICLKDSKRKTEELVYIGTAEECFLFPYEFYPNNNSYEDLLESDGWTYVDTIEV